MVHTQCVGSDYLLRTTITTAYPGQPSPDALSFSYAENSKVPEAHAC